VKVTFLGTGTSTGVPVPGCECIVCTSDSVFNKRLRTSVFVEVAGVNILIDTSTDLRQQILRFGYRDIDGVIYTHAHADHIMGLDDLRAFNFKMQREVPIFCDEETEGALSTMFYYAFHPNPHYEGGAPPRLVLNRISASKSFSLKGVEILPVPIFHGRKQILGIKIGGFAYLTDCSNIPPETVEQLKGIDTLVLSSLRHRQHPTHFTVLQALEAISTVSPARAFLTHLSHELEHELTNKFLVENGALNVEVAYDGLTIEVSD